MIIETLEGVDIMKNSNWKKIDYSNKATLPTHEKPCLVAWEGSPDSPDRNKIYEIVRDDEMVLWADVISGDVMDWLGVDENPTHWMYVPEFNHG